MAKDNTKQTPIVGDEDSWEMTLAKAKQLPSLLPKLKFGADKLAEVTVDVEFTEAQPRVITFEDAHNGNPNAKAWAINVRVLSGPENGANRALIFAKSAEHGLTRGLLGAIKEAGGMTMGLRLRIETKNYQNKRFKTLTRGYNVSILPGQSSAP